MARPSLDLLKLIAALVGLAFVAGVLVGRYGELPLLAPRSAHPAPAPLVPLADEVWTGQLAKVVDGDTMTVNWHGYELYLRLRNVDTAEAVHPDATRNTAEGRAISAWAKDYLADLPVRVELARYAWHLDTDRYGRALAYLWLDRGAPGPDAADELFNETLIRQGRSHYETGFGASPRYDERFRAADDQARVQHLGVWQH